VAVAAAARQQRGVGGQRDGGVGALAAVAAPRQSVGKSMAAAAGARRQWRWRCQHSGGVQLGGGGGSLVSARHWQWRHNQQSIIIIGGNSVRNGDNDRDNNDDKNEGDGCGGGSLAAARQQWQRQRSSSGGGGGGRGDSTVAAAAARQQRGVSGQRNSGVGRDETARKGVSFTFFISNKPIGASPGRDYVLTRMVIQII
jgi:hypothetical protein